jgi:hypothetical protein
VTFQKSEDLVHTTAGSLKVKKCDTLKTILSRETAMKMEAEISSELSVFV